MSATPLELDRFLMLLLSTLICPRSLARYGSFSETAMSAYRTPQPPEPEEEGPRHRSEVALSVAGLLLAMLPFVVLGAGGSADPLDLGVATILLIFLLSSFARRWRGTEPEHPRNENR